MIWRAASSRITQPKVVTLMLIALLGILAFGLWVLRGNQTAPHEDERIAAVPDSSQKVEEVIVAPAMEEPHTPPTNPAPHPATEEMTWTPLVWGRVTDGAGFPAGEAVIALSVQGQIGAPPDAVVVADFDGNYEIQGSPQAVGGAYGVIRLTVAVEAPGCALARETAALSSENPAVRLDFRLPADMGNLSGWVRWSDGSPVADAWIRVLPEQRDDMGQQECRSDEDGRFHLSALATNPVRLEAAPPEGPFESVGAFEVGAEDAVITLSPRTGWVRGHAIGVLTGRPLLGIPLRIDDQCVVVTNEEGQFRFENLPLGKRLRIGCRTTFYNNPGPEITLTAAQPTQEVTLELAERLVASGTVVDGATGEPVEGVTVRMTPGVTGVSDDSGHFEIENVFVSEGFIVTIEIPDPEWVLAQGLNVVFANNPGGLTDLRVEVTRGDALEILALDPANHPVPGASLSLWSPEEGRPQRLGATGSDGRLRMACVPWLQERRVVGIHPQYPVIISPPLENGPNSVVARALEVGGVCVNIVDQEGEPIPHADLTHAPLMEMGSPADDQVFPLPRVARILPLDPIEADESGQVRLRRVPMGPHLFRASMDGGFLATEVVDLAEQRRPIEITLQLEQMTVAGRVVDQDSQPIGGASISWISQERSRSGEQVTSVVTNSAGHFELPWIENQPYVGIAARADGFAESMLINSPGMDPVIRPGDDDLEIQLQASLQVIGRVVREDGSIPSSGQVACWYPANPDSGAGWHQQTFPGELEDGVFVKRFSRPPAISTPVWLLILTPEGELAAVDFTFEPSPQGVIDVGTHTLHPWLSLSGVVTDEQGNPIDGASVTWESSTPITITVPGIEWDAQTDSEGRFTLSGLPPGHWRFCAGAEQMRANWFEVTLPAEEDVTFELSPAGGVTVTALVLGSDHNPLPMTSVSIRRSESDRTHSRSVRTDHSGAARFDGVSPGLKVVTVWFRSAPTSVRVGREIEVHNQDVSITFDVSTWNELSIRALRENALVPNVPLEVQSENLLTSVTGRTNNAGVFTCRLPPDQYNIVVGTDQAGYQIIPVNLTSDQRIDVEVTAPE